MKLLTTSLLALLLITGTSHAFADVQNRHIGSFNGISLSAAFDVYVSQGDAEAVKVDAPANMMKDILTDVKDGTLNLRTRNHISWGGFFSHQRVVIYVTVKNINHIGLSGSGNIYFKDGLTANGFDLKSTGSGDVLGKLNARTFNCSMSGSGDTKLSGRVEKSIVSVTGSGDFEARNLLTVFTMIHTSGSGDAEIHATQRVDARVSGSGDIRYTGSAKQVSVSSTGSGDIRRF